MIKNVHSMYNVPSVYNQGGGGGGGEIIPIGYSKVYYLEFKSTGSEDSFNFSINDLKSDDKYYLTLFINSASVGTSEFRIIEVRNGNNFISAYVYINGVTNYTIHATRLLFNGIDVSCPIGNLQLNFVENGKVSINGSNYSLANGPFSSGVLNYFLDHLHYNSPERLNGTKFFKCRITDSSDNLKYNFIPIVNNNTGVAYILETVTGVLKTNDNWIPGPVVE